MNPRGSERRSEDGDKPDPRRRLRDLLRLLQGHRAPLLLVAGISILVSSASLGQPLLVGVLIENVQSGTPTTYVVWILVVLVVLASVLTALQQFVLYRLGEQTVFEVRRRLLSRMFRLPVVEYDHRDTADLVSRLTNDTTMLRAALVQGVSAVFGGVVMLVGAVISMALIDIVLFLVTFGVVAASLFIVMILGARLQAASHDLQASTGRLASAAERALRAIRTVRAANATAREQAAVTAKADEARMSGVRFARVLAVLPRDVVNAG